MLITIDDVLTPEELATARDLLLRSTWSNGQITAGLQAAKAKNNEQLAENAEHLPALRRLVLKALGRNAMFFTAALPLKILPPFFNRYSGDSNYYGFHTANASPLPNPASSIATARCPTESCQNIIQTNAKK